MRWAKPNLTREELLSMKAHKRSPYAKWLSDNRAARTIRSEAALDFDEGKRGTRENGWKHKRFTSNRTWTWGAFNALCELVESTEWDYFFTITARHKMNGNSARKVAERFGEFVSEDFSDVRIFWVTEEHKNHGMHIHGVLKIRPAKELSWIHLVRTAQRAVGGKRWKNNAGESGLWHRVDFAECKQSHKKYLSKYLTKGVADWDLFVKLEGETLQKCFDF